MSVAYLSKSCIHHYYHGVNVLEKLKDKISNAQKRRSVGMANHLFGTYKNTFMPQDKHIFHTKFDITVATMFSYPSSKYALPHWKFVLCCCAQCPRIDITSPE